MENWNRAATFAEWPFVGSRKPDWSLSCGCAHERLPFSVGTCSMEQVSVSASVSSLRASSALLRCVSEWIAAGDCTSPESGCAVPSPYTWNWSSPLCCDRKTVHLPPLPYQWPMVACTASFGGQPLSYVDYHAIFLSRGDDPSFSANSACPDRDYHQIFRITEHVSSPLRACGISQ